ncbi:hypothetical protein EDD17DRAFT_1508611 [Pisolithus thermaeus]|nr:hypothetical protein EDD17DRAFT_1508611 [Pisolithus thermaeus]
MEIHVIPSVVFFLPHCILYPVQVVCVLPFESAFKVLSVHWQLSSQANTPHIVQHTPAIKQVKYLGEISCRTKQSANKATGGKASRVTLQAFQKKKGKALTVSSRPTPKQRPIINNHPDYIYGYYWIWPHHVVFKFWGGGDVHLLNSETKKMFILTLIHVIIDPEVEWKIPPQTAH